MAIKNFYYWLALFAVMLTSQGCESFRHQRSQQPPTQDILLEEVKEVKTQVKTPEFANKSAPRLGLILSAGGALTYAQIGFLRELERQKIPVHVIGGLEWGALVSATYAHEGTAHGVEWKLLKLPFDKFEQSGFFSRGPKAASVSDFDKTIKGLFPNKHVKQGSLSFACTYTDLNSGQTLLAEDITYFEQLNKCWPYPPHFKIETAAAQPLAVASLAKVLRKMGADKVIYVDVVSQHQLKVDEPLSKLLWSSLSSASMEGVDEVFHFKSSGHSLQSYSAVRALIRAGETKSHNFVKELGRKYAF